MVTTVSSATAPRIVPAEARTNRPRSVRGNPGILRIGLTKCRLACCCPRKRGAFVKKVEVLYETGDMGFGTDVFGRSAPLRILLVEDDPRATLLIGEMLRSAWPERLVLSHT